MAEASLTQSSINRQSVMPYVAKTERGKKFAAIRAEIVATNVPLLDRKCLAREIAERRDETDDQLS